MKKEYFEILISVFILNRIFVLSTDVYILPVNGILLTKYASLPLS